MQIPMLTLQLTREQIAVCCELKHLTMLADAEMTVLPKACMCVYGESYSTPAESLPETMRLSGIEGSYRPVSCARCAALSVFGVHNETVNIWTHLLGAPQLLLPVLIDTDSQSDSQTTLPLGVIRHPMNRMRRCLEQRCRGNHTQQG